jgi:DMSO/TMAO reductase YedYZ molybdopterin-dependent catalytic subunit
VTTWSKFDIRWGGVRFVDLIEFVKPTPNAKYVIAESSDGYTTNNPLEEMLDENILLAYELDGAPLPREHGGPVRVIIPHLYAWKGAKFLKGLRFQAEDEPGFWETRGYHNHGDPWKEERYSEG